MTSPECECGRCALCPGEATVRTYPANEDGSHDQDREPCTCGCHEDLGPEPEPRVAIHEGMDAMDVYRAGQQPKP